MSETQLVASIRERFALERGVILWRNNTGKLQDARGRWVTYGIGVGGADLVGIVDVRSVDVIVECNACFAEATGAAPLFGRFFALECKVDKRKVTPEQIAWARVVRDHGGFCATVRSTEDAVAALERCRRGEPE
jgi:hypothetical protein